MKRMMQYLLFGLLLSALYTAEAQTINAASCSGSDVQTAFNAVSNTTTIVNIPAGTCTWTSGVSLTIPSGSTSLSVIGAGSQSTVGGGDQTVIIDDVSHSPTDNPALSIMTGSGNSSFRLSGITLKSGSSSSASFNGSLRVSGNSGLVRIDHSHLAQLLDGKQMAITGCVYGVMDHSVIDLSAGSTNNAVFIDQGSCGGDPLGVGNGQWNTSTNLGSASFFYFENNIFNGGTPGSSNIVPFADDCSGGGRFVFRFNTLNAVELQTHATGHSNNPPDRNCRAYEIYGNTFGLSNTSTTWPASAGFYVTGGTGVIWGNNVPGYYKNLIAGRENRANNGTYTQSAPPNGWGYCGTAQTGTASNWDENSDSSGYACLDQIGRGKGDLLQGSFPKVCDASSTDCGNGIYTGRWPNQALEPVYEWLDTWNPVPNWPSVLFGEDESQVMQNRDYYLYTSSFTGATGVGSGTLAARPSKCTTGVAYWASDQGDWNQSGSGVQGELFKCTSTNTWTLYYTPYTYPHPLATGSPAATLYSPTGLKGVIQ